MPGDAIRARPSLPAVDYIKSAAILAVLVQHGVPAAFERPLTSKETMIFGIVCFHVPAFLFLSGFLSHAETAVAWRDVGARLRRIVPPYLVATAVACAFGFVPNPTPRRLLFVSVTGATFGHYYFVPVLVGCVLLLPVLSRMSTGILLGGTLLLLVVAEYMWSTPTWRLAYDIFWSIRHPILQCYPVFFALGIVSARLRPTLEYVGTTYRSAAISFATVAVVLFAVFGPEHERIFHPVARTAYMLSIVALVAASVPRTLAPAWIRFLGDATFTIYLYHWFAYAAVGSLLPVGLPLMIYICVHVFVGLAFSTMLTVFGRRVLGARSRVLLGT